MIIHEVQNCFNGIIRSIEQRKLKITFDLLTKLLSQMQDWQLQAQLDTLKNTYKTMLFYLAENIKDPEREKIYRTLLCSLCQIADTALWRIKSANDNSLFYEKRRSYSFNVSETSEDLIIELKNIYKKIALSLYDEEKKALVREKENLNQKVFHKIWLSDCWTIDEKDKWTEIVNQSEERILPCLIITAITLNLLETFDEKKVILLLEATQNECNEIGNRALTGIVPFLRKYNYRLHLYPAITEHLNSLAENPKIVKKFCYILLQFISSKETEKITRRITDELLPEIVQKIGTKIKDKLKTTDLSNDNEINDKNPEWHHLIEKSGIEKKLQEISEWQIEGADVMHSSFIHLKNYPFFEEISNWFIPFTAPSEAIGNAELIQLVDILTTSTFLCNSDKYSFYLSICQIPENARRIMIKQFSVEANILKDKMKEEFNNISLAIDYSIRQYIQDLYRFYKLYPKKQNFEDIFETHPEFYQVSSIYQLIGNEKNLSIIGEHYFNKNYFEEAIDIYDKLLQTDPNNDVLYQKKGYCLQMKGQFITALNAYQKAELLNANHSWTIKKLAYLYRVLKNPKEALYYYKKAEQLNPNNLSIQLNIGHCYLEIGKFEQALKYYFKVEYLKEDTEKIWRLIGWCSFLIGNYQQAINYFNKIIERKSNMMDYLNAGHVQLTIGQTREAIRLYKVAIEKENCSYEKFIEIFSNDIPYLTKAGIPEENISFIIDICYLL